MSEQKTREVDTNRQGKTITNIVKDAVVNSMDVDEQVARCGIKYLYSRTNRIGMDYVSVSKDNIWQHPESNEQITLKEPAWFTPKGLPVFLCLRGVPYSIPMEFSEQNEALAERDLTSFETKSMIFSQFKQGIFKPRRRLKLENIWSIVSLVIVVAFITSLIWLLSLGGLGVIQFAGAGV